jgi:hypothetical protein
VRNENRRLRIGTVDVKVHTKLPADHPALQGCLAIFEDFCIVTQSVRSGIDVNVRVERRAHQDGSKADVRAARDVGSVPDDDSPLVRGAVATWG